ncbi:MAG TPA: ubiquinone/menaquinone biosynthesis methyltransferase [Acidimicrobiales bacterium]|nr:ubiquinone/menaquinone biosynthesis methyltransferase [Acidimicrobiales bacterium]
MRTGIKRRQEGDRLDELPTGANKTVRVRSMFDAIAPRYDLVNRLMTFGLDRGWRRTTVAALGLAPGSTVLDLACGTGDLASLAGRCGYRTLGADLSWGMLEAGHARPVLQADASRLPLPDGALDGVVCGYALRNFADLAGSLAEAARVLRPGGRLAVLEVAAPKAGVLRAGYRLWFEHVVPVLGGILSDADAYRYLPRSVAYLPDEPALRQLFTEAGFATVGRRLLHGGLSQLITATRSGLPPGAEPTSNGAVR